MIGSPPGLILLTIFFVYIGSRCILGKKNLYTHLKEALFLGALGVLVYMYFFPNTKSSQAINQYYKERQESRRKFYDSIGL
jgi:hypothetical protein